MGSESPAFRRKTSDPGASWPAKWPAKCYVPLLNCVCLSAALLACFAVSSLQAATFVVNNTNAAGQGFNSTTPVDPVTGNPATTLGAQRLAAFQAAADAWGSMLVSDVTILVDAQMTSLTCTPTSATLGSAGASNAYRDFPGAPVANTWYAAALADALAGADLDPGDPDISANFNQNIGTPGCLTNAPWSYVIGAPVPVGTISFFNTVVHEIGHGVGFFTLVNKSNGAPVLGIFDIYARFLLDETPTPTLWTALNNAGRAASATDNGNLTWAGAEVLNVADLLTAGRHATSGRVRMYAPTVLATGSSVSHFDLALTPNEIMEPSLQNVNQKLLTNHLMLDIGWTEMLALAVTMTDGQTALCAGSATSYTATITNSGPEQITVVDATVIDNLPPALTGATWTCGGTGGATCGAANGVGSINTTVTVPRNGVITFTILATISPAFTGIVSNTLSVGMPANIQNTVSSSATDETTVTQPTQFSVSAISGNTTEAGGQATFSVVLLQQPTANVSIGLSSSDATEGTVSTSSLVFTNGDWNTPQFVTVTGVDDEVDDGDQAYQVITATAVSTDGVFGGVNPPDVAAVNIDDDTAGITVSAISGNTTEAGGTATFTVVLNSEPTQNVDIGLSSSDLGEATVLPVNLQFTSGNWSTPQLVTVTGVNDAVDDDDVGFTIVTAAATSTDPNYSGLNANDVNVTNVDDDTAGITVSAISGNTTEAGGTATFTVVLNSEPTQNVSIGLSSSDTTEGTVAPPSLQFTNGDWSAPRLVTVTGVNDSVDDGDVVFSIITAPASSIDPKYNGMNASDVGVSNVDDDTAGITVSAISGNTTEAGGTASFTIVLDSQPTQNVSIGLSSADTTEGTVQPVSLQFTSGDWSTPKLVTVTGVNDDMDDDDVVFSIITAPASSTDPGYSGLNANDVSVTNVDNDTAGITVSAISGNTTEAGGTATFSVVLNSEPTQNVSIGLSSSDTSEGTVLPASLQFTSGDWSTPKLVTVTGVNDDVDDGDVVFSIITAPATSTDPKYNSINANDVSVTNIDDDMVGITVSAISGNTTEAGGAATFTVVLDVQPTQNVTIGLSSSDTTEGSVLPASLLFTNGNWNTPQMVTVTGVNDDVDDGNVQFQIVTAAATSTDPNYSGLNANDVNVTNVNDDTAGITVSTISANTTEAGGTATFTVVLNSEPTQNVSIGLSSSDTTEGTVLPVSVQFTSGNWDTPQLVTVTGVNDDVDDDNAGFTIVTAPATSTDPGYSGLNPNDVGVTNVDDDVAGITVSPISRDTSEPGESATFTIVLDSEPTHNVTIGLSSSDTTEGTVLPASVSFNSGDWDTPKLVTVTGVDDAVDDDAMAYSIMTAPAVSSDVKYSGLDAADVAVINQDDEGDTLYADSFE